MAKNGSETMTFQQRGDVTVGVLQTTEITSKVNDALEARLKELQKERPAVKLVLDLSKLDFLGSVGLSVLVVFLQRIKKNGGQLALTGLKGLCRDVMHVTGMEKAFQLFGDVPAAVDAMNQP